MSLYPLCFLPSLRPLRLCASAVITGYLGRMATPMRSMRSPIPPRESFAARDASATLVAAPET